MPGVFAVISWTLVMPSAASGSPSVKTVGFLMYVMASMRKPPTPFASQKFAAAKSASLTAGFSQLRSGCASAKVCR